MSDLVYGGLTGSFVEGFYVQIPFALKSKSNFRRFQKKAVSWADHASFEDRLGLLVRAAAPDTWDKGDFDLPLKKRPVVVSFIVANTLLDAANLSKSVLDACQGSVFHNDASVLHSASAAIRTGKDVGGYLAFARLLPESSVDSMIEASYQLSKGVMEKAQILRK